MFRRRGLSSDNAGSKNYVTVIHRTTKGHVTKYWRF